VPLQQIAARVAHLHCANAVYGVGKNILTITLEDGPVASLDALCTAMGRARTVSVRLR
jgi:hypothetical protein